MLLSKTMIGLYSAAARAVIFYAMLFIRCCEISLIFFQQRRPSIEVLPEITRVISLPCFTFLSYFLVPTMIAWNSEVHTRHKTNPGNRISSATMSICSYISSSCNAKRMNILTKKDEKYSLVIYF